MRFRYTVMGLFYFSAELYSIIRKRETDMVVKRYYNFLVAAKRFVNEVNCRQLCADKSKRMLKYKVTKVLEVHFDVTVGQWLKLNILRKLIISIYIWVFFIVHW